MLIYAQVIEPQLGGSSTSIKFITPNFIYFLRGEKEKEKKEKVGGLKRKRKTYINVHIGVHQHMNIHISSPSKSVDYKIA